MRLPRPADAPSPRSSARHSVLRDGRFETSRTGVRGSSTPSSGRRVGVRPNFAASSRGGEGERLSHPEGRRPRCRAARPPGRDTGKFPTEIVFAHFRITFFQRFQRVKVAGCKKTYYIERSIKFQNRAISKTWQTILKRSFKNSRSGVRPVRHTLSQRNPIWKFLTTGFRALRHGLPPAVSATSEKHRCPHGPAACRRCRSTKPPARRLRRDQRNRTVSGGASRAMARPVSASAMAAKAPAESPT